MIENKRCLNELTSRLEEVAYRGYTIIRRYELYAWYKRERLTQNVFRHLVDVYHEVAGSKRRLSVLVEEGAYLLIDPGKVQSAAEAFGLEQG